MKHYTFDVETPDGVWNQYTYLAHDLRDAESQLMKDVPNAVMFQLVGEP